MLQPGRKYKRDKRRTGLKDLLREEHARLSRLPLLDCKLYGSRLTIKIKPKPKKQAAA